MPGRSVYGDAQDIAFMRRELESRVEQQDVDYLTQRPNEEWLTFRNVGGSNLCFEYLVDLWHILNPHSEMVKDTKDFRADNEARTRRFTPACPLNERHRCSSESGMRAYLSKEQEKATNCGIVDYSQYYSETSQLSKLLATLQSSLDYFRQRRCNPVAKWLNNMKENELVDPNIFDPCCCGRAALKSLVACQNEDEIDEDPCRSSLPTYSPTFVNYDVMHQRCLLWKAGKEPTKEERIPRSKKISQICELHELMSSNLFVLVDTSAKDIRDRLDSESGPLPVPGFLEMSRYPPGFETLPRLVEIPYRQLFPRFVHGLMHLPADVSCETCFQPGQHDECVECAKYEVAVLTSDPQCYLISVPLGTATMIDCQTASHCQHCIT